MKSKYIYPCVVALAIATGCIKEQGDEGYTISRKVADKGNDTIPLTIVSDVEGFMYGKAYKDTLIDNNFKAIYSTNSTQGLDCYISISSKYTELDLDRNAVKGAGYVISHSNTRPVLEGDDCDKFLGKYVKYDSGDSTETDISFTGECHELDVNKRYYLRSYVLTTQGDTIYNPRVLQVTTRKPKDVWVQRSNCPTIFTGRMNPFTCEYNGSRYIYGGKSGMTYFCDMWSYDTDEDTWTQRASYDNPSGRFLNTNRRSNGAMFTYPTSSDVLFYIAGGECSEGVLKSVMFYSTTYNRFCTASDHPNYSKKITVYDSDGNVRYTTETVRDAEGNIVYNEDGSVKTKEVEMQVYAGREYVEDLPEALCGCVAFSMKTSGGTYYYVGFGKTNKEEGASGINSLVYQYDEYYDCLDYEYPDNHNYTWTERGSTTENNGSGEGLYQPVCVVCGTRTVIGTGQSSKGGVSNSFWTLSVGGTGLITLKTLKGPGDEFTPRANAAGFYLSYQDVDDGQQYSKFYIGTGRDCEETDAPTTIDHLLCDFWSYDFNTGTWAKQADCSNIRREGAIGFPIERNDDSDNSEASHVRGMFSFGFGAPVTEEYLENPESVDVTTTYLKDNWEYLP